jgi:hypothetical protein
VIFLVHLVPYDKEGKIWVQEASMPPPPNIPQPHPERPPPNVPIPGEPTAGNSEVAYTCPVCKKVFNSEDELQLHMETDHKSRIK